VTRQKVGRLRSGAGTPAIVRSPDVTGCARVMVVSGSLRSLRAEQSAARSRDEGSVRRQASRWGSLGMRRPF